MAKNKNPIPKKIAGLKVPKTLRKSKTLHSLLQSPMGREIVANALTAGAGAAAAVLLRNRDEIEHAAAGGARKGARAHSVASDAMQEGASAIIGVVTEAARSSLPKDVRKSGRPSSEGARH